MYFPFLYGRRSELLALRAMLEDQRSLEALVPVVEPVNRNIADLVKCIDAFGKKDQPLAIIVNPDKYQLKPASEAEAWREDMLPAIDKYSCVLPAYRCVSSTPMTETTSFLKQFANREMAIVYSSPGLTDAQLRVLVGTKRVRFHIVLNGKMSETQQALLPANKRIDIRDYFNKLERNSDYSGAELFTDRYRTFKPTWVGFGDYASIGSAFVSGGTQPAAVVIHAIYRHKTGSVWIEHFVSDDTDKEIGAPASKFVQAAKKLVKAARSRPREFGTNFALDGYAVHVANNHFPGLGSNKTLQIEHHICLMLDVLSGDL